MTKVQISPTTELIALDLSDAEQYLAVKPIVPHLTPREWLLLVAAFGLREAYKKAFMEYWCQQNVKKPLFVTFTEWLVIAGVPPEFAPVTDFVF